MKQVLLLSFYFLSFFINAQLTPSLWQINDTKITTWYYDFGDEFIGQVVDANKWYDNYPWGGLSIKDGIYAVPENTRIEGGKAILKVDTVSSYRTFPDWMLEEELKKNNPLIVNKAVKLKYATAVLWSKQQFKYGYFECRCFIPAGKGLWPAFWLYGGKPNDEIDFMESKGEKRNEFHVDIHCPNACDKIKVPPFNYTKPWGKWMKTKNSLVGEWAVFSGIWQPGQVTFFMNGRPVAKYMGDFSADMNMIANLSVAFDGGPFSPGPNSKTVFPSEFLVDYMRVWKLPSESTPPSTHKGRFTEGKRSDKSISSNEDIARNNKLHMFQLEGTEGNFLNRKSRKKVAKELVQSEQGFISLMPVNEEDFQLHFNGIANSNVKVEIISDRKELVKSFDIKGKYHFFSTNDLPSGGYKLVISNGQAVTTEITFTKL